VCRFLCGALAVFAVSCEQASPKHAKITDFKADPSFVSSGVTGRLCYGVENTARLAIDPPIESLLPATARCIDIAPQQTTTYTLTAYGTDGGSDKKSVEVKVGPPPPRVADLVAKPLSVRKGRQVKVCFKLENAKSVTAKPGKLDRKTNCLIDYPKKTTTYRVTAYGDDRQQDVGTVTVNVLR
jgi:hypothetical protein